MIPNIEIGKKFMRACGSGKTLPCLIHILATYFFQFEWEYNVAHLACCQAWEKLVKGFVTLQSWHEGETMIMFINREIKVRKNTQIMEQTWVEIFSSFRALKASPGDQNHRQIRFTNHPELSQPIKYWWHQRPRQIWSKLLHLSFWLEIYLWQHKNIAAMTNSNFETSSICCHTTWIKKWKKKYFSLA